MERLLAALRELSLDPAAAAAERVAPLLYSAAPAGASPLLRKAYYESAANNLLLLDALDELTRAFTARGVRFFVLKGADFARSLYPDAALRPMGDLDVLVASGDLAQAEAALAGLGYRPGIPEMASGLSRAARHARLYARGNVGVDLHWSLVGHESDERAPSLEWFWGRTAGLGLDPTASLLYLAAHMKLQHFDERPPLVWLADVLLLAERPDVDWTALFDAARDFGWEAALAATAFEVESRLGLKLPAPLSARAMPFSTADHDRPGRAEHAWVELRTLPFRRRAALARAILFPAPSYVRFRYRPRPGWIWPLFYPIRWARVLAGLFSVLVKPRGARPLSKGIS
jgi:hypothetical protein